MRRLLPIIFLLSLIPISGVHAAQWSRIATKDKVRLEVDAASIVKGEEGKVKLWHREVNPVPKVPDSGAFTFIKRTMLTEFNCAKRTTTPVQQIYTAPDGGELKAESFDGADAQPLLPDSTTVLQDDAGVVARIDRFHRRQLHAGRIGRNQKQADAGAFASLAGGACGDDEGIGTVAIHHPVLVAIEAIAVAVGHRSVHGGEEFNSTTIIDQAALQSRYQGRHEFIDRLLRTVRQSQDATPDKLRAAARAADRIRQDACPGLQVAKEEQRSATRFPAEAIEMAILRRRRR